MTDPETVREILEYAKDDSLSPEDIALLLQLPVSLVNETIDDYLGGRIANWGDIEDEDFFPSSIDYYEDQ